MADVYQGTLGTFEATLEIGAVKSHWGRDGVQYHEPIDRLTVSHLFKPGDPIIVNEFAPHDSTLEETPELVGRRLFEQLKNRAPERLSGNRYSVDTQVEKSERRDLRWRLGGVMLGSTLVTIGLPVAIEHFQRDRMQDSKFLGVVAVCVGALAIARSFWKTTGDVHVKEDNAQMRKQDTRLELMMDLLMQDGVEFKLQEQKAEILK